MATNNDMDHLVGAVRELLRDCDLEPMQWFEKLQAPWPPPLTEEGNRELTQFFELAEFDPLDALADRENSRNPSEIVRSPSRIQPKTASRSATPGSHTTHKPAASKVATAADATPRKNHSAQGQTAHEDYSHFASKHATSAIQQPRLEPGERHTSAEGATENHNFATSIPPRQTATPEQPKRDTSTAAADKQHQWPQRTGIPSRALKATALASRRRALSRQQTLQPSANFLPQESNREKPALAIASASPSSTRTAADTSTRNASEQPFDKLSQVAFAPRERAQPDPSSAPHPRVHDVASAVDRPASSESSESRKETTKSTENHGGLAANSDDVAAQLADAAYRHGVDLS